MVHFHIELAEQQLQHIAGNAQLVVIHPNYMWHRFLFEKLLEPDNSVYVRFEGDQIDGGGLRNQLELALSDQTEHSDLSGVSNLILDECDRLSEDALDDFLASISSTFLLDKSKRVVLVSRKTPRFVLKKIDMQEMMAFVPVDEELMLCDYVRTEEKTALLEVHAFGSGRVFLNGQEVNSWDGVLPRSLFFYLVDRGMTTRNDIFKIFWPNLTTKEATNVFHVTKRKISEVLGIDLTIYWSGFYRISPDIELNYDAMQFSKMVQDSEVSSSDEARDLLTRAISLYRGEFLTSLDLDWTINRRQALLQTYGEALVSLAKMAENSGDIATALGLYLRSTLTNPQREDLVQTIMTLYDGLGMQRDALIIYKRLEQELQDKLGLKPAPQLRELADVIRSKMK